MQRDLDKLVEVVRRNLIADACPRKVHSYSASNELVVGSNNKRAALQEQQQANGLQCRNGRLRETAVKVVHEHNKGDLQLFQKLLKRISKCLNLTWQRDRLGRLQ